MVVFKRLSGHDVSDAVVNHVLCWVVGFVLAFGITGCGKSSAVDTTPGQAPSMVKQPKDASIPFGLAAHFSVTTTGSSLRYQWRRNGEDIPGATSATLAFTPDSWSDSGTKYDVVVSNVWGSVTSNAAILTLTARAPKSGDLRFQNVDADSTVNGNEGDFGSRLFRGVAEWDLGGLVGSPLQMGLQTCTTGPVGCSWAFDTFDPPYGVVVPKLKYRWLMMSEVQNQLSQLAASGYVVTSLDVEPAFDQAAVAWVENQSDNHFSGAFHVTDVSTFESEAIQEGLHGRVITGAAFDEDKIDYLSYGWDADTTTAYDVSVAFVAQSEVVDKASELAQEGFILTAFSVTNSGKAILVGTRVQGDSMPRLFSTDFRLETNGYACVGMMNNPDGSGLAIRLLER